jgi:hypothetical protein
MHLFVAVGILFFTLALDVGLMGLLISDQAFPALADSAQVETVKNLVATWLAWAIPRDLILIALTAAQYGFCAQRSYFTKRVVATTFWMVLFFLCVSPVSMTLVPGYWFLLVPMLFLVFEVIVMWLYVYRSPHLWKLETSATL